jgi:hypothetical protein
MTPFGPDTDAEGSPETQTAPSTVNNQAPSYPRQSSANSDAVNGQQSQPGQIVAEQRKQVDNSSRSYDSWQVVQRSVVIVLVVSVVIVVVLPLRPVGR